MVATTLAPVSVDEYLRTIYHPDREYWDGTVQERNVGSHLHSLFQGRLIEVFYDIRRSGPALYARPELRIRVGPTRFLIPDVCVYEGAVPSVPVPSTPPLIVVEVISPDDRFHDVVEKAKVYRAFGVPHVWLVDPDAPQLFVCDDQGCQEVAAWRIERLNVEITLEQLLNE